MNESRPDLDTSSHYLFFKLDIINFIYPGQLIPFPIFVTIATISPVQFLGFFEPQRFSNSKQKTSQSHAHHARVLTPHRQNKHKQAGVQSHAVSRTTVFPSREILGAQTKIIREKQGRKQNEQNNWSNCSLQIDLERKT
ncbi:hypothetical protein VTN49DRAFT_6226 [Thermomyces lanuginosus]|uniref:uncharacterized protein n=1 Tax=Thermomyces lanuginosus TaxID=5541 RepID=UPI0037427B10